MRVQFNDQNSGIVHRLKADEAKGRRIGQETDRETAAFRRAGLIVILPILVKVFNIRQRRLKPLLIILDTAGLASLGGCAQDFRTRIDDHDADIRAVKKPFTQNAEISVEGACETYSAHIDFL